MTITLRAIMAAEIDTTNSAAIEFDAVNGVDESTTQVKTGTYSYAVQLYFYGARKSIPATRQARAGCHFRAANGGGTNGTWILFFQAATSAVLIGVRVKGTQLQLVVNGTQQDSYDSVVTTAFQHYCLNVKVHASAGWAVLYIDSVEVMRYEGNTGDLDLVNFYVGNNDLTTEGWSNSVYYDDIYVEDLTSEGSSACGQPYRYFFVRPNGNGNYSGMTGSDGDSTDNYLLVDDTLNDGDTTYVYATATDVKDTYAMSNVTVPVGYAVTAVIPTIIGKKGSASDIQARPTIRQNSTDWEGTAVALGTSYTNPFVERRTLAPDGTSWDETKVNAMEVGAESAGTFA